VIDFLFAVQLLAAQRAHAALVGAHSDDVRGSERAARRWRRNPPNFRCGLKDGGLELIPRLAFEPPGPPSKVIQLGHAGTA
jgi:hypothetical protein